jgi:hypothetical protein
VKGLVLGLVFFVLCGVYSLPYVKAEMFSFVCAVETIGFRLVFGF